MKDCAVCCEPFNKTSHARIACEQSGACAFEACKTCVRTYLMNTTSDPNCMQCNKAWSDKFLAQKLTTTFMRGDYAVHRKELLVQQQLSRMPETMAAAENYMRISAIETQIKELNTQMKLARQEDSVEGDKFIRTINFLPFDDAPNRKVLIDENNVRIANFRGTVQLLNRTIHALKHTIAVIHTGGEVSGEVVERSARKFIMPCTNADCRGYLSTQYKCELCEHHTCAKCLGHIGLTKGDGNGEGSLHVCKQENIDSADHVRKHTKPCPCCGARISKIDGCDQMWCTQCRKAFSWNTGNLVTGVVHNPHFYQYQREIGGGVAPRNPGDEPAGAAGAGAVCDVPNTFPRYIRVVSHIQQAGIPEPQQKTLSDTIMAIHQLQAHFSNIYISPLRRLLQVEQNFEPERIKYIVKEISREQLATAIMRKDKERKTRIAELHVCDLYKSVAIDMFNMLLANTKTGLDMAADLEKFIAESISLREYCNTQFKEISMVYGVCVPYFSENWQFSQSKFKASTGELDNYIIKREEKKAARELLQKEKLRIEEAARQLAEKRNAHRWGVAQEAAATATEV